MSGAPATPAPAPCLQDAILHLQWFWAAQGCLLLESCDFAVPYATLHPDAFFGIVTSESWRAAFPQPVRRPLDGRYGKHPYRLGKHLQLQVELKPPPEDVQSLYLESLEALGFELALHDVRFVEWGWEPRSLGGGGEGWHALMDGLGVTRITFLDRIAGRQLEPPCVEISYGLERLVMTLQGAASAYRLNWSEDGLDYGRLRRRDEEELSRYAFEVADAGGLRRRLEALEEETERCLASGLARAAYELAVRCLEPIDLLDARGELSSRERARRQEWVGQRVAASVDLRATTEEKSPAAAPEPAAPEPSAPRKQRRRKTSKRARPKGRRGGSGDDGAAGE